MHFNSNLICSVLIAANAVIAAPIAAPKAKPAPTPEPVVGALKAIKPAAKAGKFLWKHKGTIFNGVVGASTILQGLPDGDDDDDDDDDENHQASQPPTVDDFQEESFEDVPDPLDYPNSMDLVNPVESPAEYPAEYPAEHLEEYPVELPVELPAEHPVQYPSIPMENVVDSPVIHI